MSPRKTVPQIDGIPLSAFVENLIDMIRKKQWEGIREKLDECSSLPCDDPSVIEIFLRLSRAGQARLVDLLLKKGMDINASINGQSALTLSIEIADSKMVKALIARHADVNMLPRYMKTSGKGPAPLVLAVLSYIESEDTRDRKSFKNIIELLIGAKADVNMIYSDEPTLNMVIDSKDRFLIGLFPTRKVLCEDKQSNNTKNRSIQNLDGMYIIDMEGSIHLMKNRIERERNKKLSRKEYDRILSHAKEMKDISITITKNTFYLSSNDGQETYQCHIKNIGGQAILEVDWGIPTQFVVHNVKENLFHFERDGNVISEVIWKKTPIENAGIGVNSIEEIM